MNGPINLPDENAWRIQPARRHIKRRRTVRHLLRDVHLSPLALRRGLQRFDTRDHFLYGFRLK
jgi:hypothetical protein